MLKPGLRSCAVLLQVNHSIECFEIFIQTFLFFYSTKSNRRSKEDGVIMQNSIFEELTTEINAVINLNNENPPPTDIREEITLDEILNLLFKIGKNKIEFSEEERKVIGPLMEEIIQNIDNFISVMITSDPEAELRNLIRRSGIQFLLDNFNEFPVTADEVLGDSLKIIQESENLEEFDESLMTYHPMGDEYVDFRPAELKRPEGVPETHKWWNNLD